MLDLPVQIIRDVLAGLGRFSLMVMEVVRSLATQRLSGRDVVAQMYFIGVRSQTVVLVTGAFTGMVLCAQTYFQFHKVKMDTATLAVVSVSMCGELGPVLTALMVAGRVGASMAAELGTMKVTEQVDALRTLAAHPIDYLVVPRVLATVLAVPLLTAESVAMGILSAYLVGVHLLQIDPGYSVVNMLRFTDHRDVLMGFIKSLIFGGIIATTGCYKGMHCGQGAEGVGHSTTEAVVYASIAILMSNFFLTMLLTRLLALL